MQRAVFSPFLVLSLVARRLSRVLRFQRGLSFIVSRMKWMKRKKRATAQRWVGWWEWRGGGGDGEGGLFNKRFFNQTTV